MANNGYKTGKISEVDRFFILGNREKGLDFLIKHTNRAPTAIEKLLADNPVVEAAPVQEAIEPVPAPRPPKAGDFYFRPNGAGNGTAIVMSQAAGERADEARQDFKNAPKRDTSGYIHRIRP